MPARSFVIVHSTNIFPALPFLTLLPFCLISHRFVFFLRQEICQVSTTCEQILVQRDFFFRYSINERRYTEKIEIRRSHAVPLNSITTITRLDIFESESATIWSFAIFYPRASCHRNLSDYHKSRPMAYLRNEIKSDVPSLLYTTLRIDRGKVGIFDFR